MQHGIAHDSTFPDITSSNLELWLDQDHDLTLRVQQWRNCGGYDAHGYETNIAYCNVAEFRNIGRDKMARIRMVLHNNSFIRANAPIELGCAYVHCINTQCTSLQQAVGKSA